MNRMFAVAALAALVVLGGIAGHDVARTQEHHAPKPAKDTPPAPPLPKAVMSEPAPPDEPPPDDLRPIAKAVITTWNHEPVPKFWPLGVPLVLTAAGSVAGNNPQSTKWEIQPPWVNKWSHHTPDGQLHVATGIKPKVIRITLYVAKDDAFDMATVTISVQPDPLEPSHGPTPPEPKPPEPQPPEPEPGPPLSAMAQQVKDLALLHIPDIASRKNQVLALATSHEAIAADVSQAVAGVPAYAHLKQPKAIVDATVQSNRTAVGGDRDPFVPFFNALNGVLKPLSKTTLSTASGHIGVWNDIAAGLRAAVP
jgi:hypothetical protein